MKRKDIYCGKESCLVLVAVLHETALWCLLVRALNKHTVVGKRGLSV